MAKPKGVGLLPRFIVSLVDSLETIKLELF